MNRFRPDFQNIFTMTPMIPAGRQDDLADLSVEIFRKSGDLRSTVSSEISRLEIARLIRESNCYHSSQMDGLKILPGEISAAAAGEYSEDEMARRAEEIAVAHLGAEIALREELGGAAEAEIFSPGFVARIHRHLFEGLPEERRNVITRDGRRLPIRPGTLRSYNVTEGTHIPPLQNLVPAFLQKFGSHYGSEEILATEQLPMLAAAHHRLSWIQPFGESRGILLRLHAQAMMISAKVDADGLWSISRAMARTGQEYERHFDRAAQRRRDPEDGKGHLSDEGLADFCCFFLELVRDEMDFMLGLLNPYHLQDRIENYLRFVRIDLESKLREHLVRLLKALVLQGEIPRGEVPHLLNLKGTASRDVIRRAREEGLVTSLSEKRPLRLGFPSKVVDSYLPGLFSVTG